MVPVEPLLDRACELAAIRALLDGARVGDGGMLLFEGSFGVGKTVLVDAAAELATGFTVLRGRGGDVERNMTFGLVRELFDPVLRAAGAATRERWLSNAAGPAASVLGHDTGSPNDPTAVAFGLYWLLAAIAEGGPVALLVDDLHACDRASVQWLSFLSRRLDGIGVAGLAAGRPAEPRALPHVAVIRPEPLGARATHDLVASRIESPRADLVGACAAATGGNPLLLVALLDALVASGVAPDDLDVARIELLAGDRLGSALLVRRGQLDEAGLALARAVAVLGDGCELRHASALADLERTAAASELPSLIAHGVLADAQPLSFAHSLIRTALYREIPAPVRAEHHRRAAELLAATNGSAELVSHHLLRAEPVGEEWALRALHDAAATAIARGAPEAAAVHLRRALQERPGADLRAELLLALGNALARLNDRDAVEVFEEALTLAQHPSARAEIVDTSVDPLLARGRTREARRLIARVLDAGQALDSEQELLLLARLAVVCDWDDGDDDRAIPALDERSPELDGTTPARRYAGAVLALLHATRLGTAESTRRLARTALGDRSAREQDSAHGRPLHIARVALALAGESQEALAGLEDALAASLARGSLLGQGLGLGWSALIRSLAGDVIACENDGRTSLALLVDSGLDGPVLGATAAVCWALIERGELDEAAELLTDPPVAFGWGVAALACVRAQLMIARHRHADALVELAPIEQLAARRVPGPWAWRTLAATARLGMGDRAGARALAGDELAEARRFGEPGRIGSALRLLGQVEGGAAGIELQAEAVAVLCGSGARLELARALVEHGAALRRAGARASSRPPLLEGLELAAACGATALGETARVELRVAGARPRRVMRRGFDALTPSERRVAGLAAEGLANAEIAQSLFVTVRTVEMHLSAAYRKLEIGSRAELPRALAP